MNWNYENKLIEYIAQAQRDSGLKDENGNDYIFEVCFEEIFVKKKNLTPGTIYVVIKQLSSTNTLNATEQPIQILVSCEQNSIQASQIIFSKLVASHNFEAIIENGTYVKQDYREPVVLSNFNEVSYGYRSIIYISATLFVMENVIDVKNVKIGFDYILEELNAQQLTALNNYFNGTAMSVKSPLYLFYTRDFTKKIIQTQTIYFLGTFYGKNSETEEEHGLFIVNGIQCAKIGSDDFGITIKLYDINDDFLSSITISQVNEITIQVLPSSYSRTFDDDNFSTIFPNIIKNTVISEKMEEDIKPINFNIAYSMTPNTQPIPPEKIATSVKSVATFSISFTTAMTSEYKYIDYVSKIMSGVYSGNINFYISFDLGDVHFVKVPMKLISAQLTTAIDQVPGLQIGLIK